MKERQPSKHILIVEDDNLSREVLELLLESTAHRIRSASSGDDALKRLSHPYPDVILTDYQMPGTMGNDLADRMRAICGPSTRLIAMSASRVAEASVDRYDGFLLKPFSSDDLERMLQSDIPRRTPEKAEEPVEDPHNVLDQEIYAGLRNSMTSSQLAALYVLCVKDVQRRIDRMRQHLQCGDDLQFKGEAHAIKGGCGMVGALEMRDLAAVMETDGIRRGNKEKQNALLLQLLVAGERLERMLKARQREGL